MIIHFYKKWDLYYTHINSNIFTNVLVELTFVFEIWWFPSNHGATLPLTFLFFCPSDQKKQRYVKYLARMKRVFFANSMFKGKIHKLGFINSKICSNSSKMNFSIWLTPAHPVRSTLSVRSFQEVSLRPPMPA